MNYGIRILGTGTWKQELPTNQTSTGKVVLAEARGIRFGTRERVGYRSAGALKTGESFQVLDLVPEDGASLKDLSLLYGIVQETDDLQRPIVAARQGGRLKIDWIYRHLRWRDRVWIFFTSMFKKLLTK